MEKKELYQYYLLQNDIYKHLVGFFVPEMIGEEYSQLIYGTGDAPVVLWESAWINSKQVLLDETTLNVKEFYQHCGVDVRQDIHQLPDHIELELEFMKIITYNIIQTAEVQEEKRFWKLLSIRNLFWKTHINRFYQKILNELEEKSKDHSIQEYVLFAKNAWSKEIEHNRIMEKLLEEEKEGPEGSDNNMVQLNLAGTERNFRIFEPVEMKEEVILTTGRGNCGGRCIIKAHVKNACLLRLETDVSEEDGENDRPIIRACVRGRGYRKTYMSPDRLRYPMKRVGKRGEGKFVRITWEEAIDTIAEETQRIGEQYGPGSRYVNYASGISAVFRGDLLARRLLSADGGFLDSYNTYSAACAEIALPYTYGTGMTGSSLKTILDTRLLILWGFNPAVTLFNPLLFSTLKQLKKNGIKIIVIDPQYSDTAAVFASQWIGIRPTTDSALVDAMAYTILEEGLENREFMDCFCIGFDRTHMQKVTEGRENYTDYLYGKYDGIVKTPTWAEKITGVSREVICQIAREYATAKPAAIMSGLGPQRHGNGEQTVRSVMILPCMTGNVGISGGHTGGSGQLVQHTWPAMPALENPYGASIPSFLWTDAILRGKEMTTKHDRVRGKEQLESNIKLIYNLAGNTLLNQHSDINRTKEILSDTSLCEFIVCSDLFMTPSAKFADILLPGTSLFESDNITMPWREGNFVLYENQAIEPLFESRFEFDWLAEVAKKMGIYNIFMDGKSSFDELLRYVYDNLQKAETELPSFEIFKKNGGYHYKKNQLYIAFKEQIEDFEHHPFPTPSGKIEIFSERLFQLKEEKLVPAIPKYVPSFEGPEDEKIKKYPLQLIGWHTKRRCHSVHDNNEWMEEIEPQRLWMNEKDAMERGLKEDDMAEVFNDRGVIHVKVHLTKRLIEGVASMPQGAWYAPDKNGVDTRGSINVITTLQPTPLAKGNPQHSNLVQIRAVKTDEK